MKAAGKAFQRIDPGDSHLRSAGEKEAQRAVSCHLLRASRAERVTVHLDCVRILKSLERQAKLSPTSHCVRGLRKEAPLLVDLVLMGRSTLRPYKVQTRPKTEAHPLNYGV